MKIQIYRSKILLISILAVVLCTSCKLSFVCTDVIPTGKGYSVFFFDGTDKRSCRQITDVWGAYIVERDSTFKIGDTIRY